jgi:hypothetical protein
MALPLITVPLQRLTLVATCMHARTFYPLRRRPGQRTLSSPLLLRSRRRCEGSCHVIMSFHGFFGKKPRYLPPPSFPVSNHETNLMEPFTRTTTSISRISDELQQFVWIRTSYAFLWYLRFFPRLGLCAMSLVRQCHRPRHIVSELLIRKGRGSSWRKRYGPVINGPNTFKQILDDFPASCCLVLRLYDDVWIVD